MAGNFLGTKLWDRKVHEKGQIEHPRLRPRLPHLPVHCRIGLALREARLRERGDVLAGMEEIDHLACAVLFQEGQLLAAPSAMPILYLPGRFLRLRT